MKKLSRPLVAVFALAIVIAAIAFGLAYMHEAGDMNGSLVLFDSDLSDSALGWAIAIPILVLVGIVVIAVLAGAAFLTVMALIFAAIITVIAILLAMTPFAIFLAIPILAIYGFVKLVQRTSPQPA